MHNKHLCLLLYFCPEFTTTKQTSPLDGTVEMKMKQSNGCEMYDELLEETGRESYQT